jgi:hypothetical protein
MINEVEYLKLKKRIERLEREREQKRGAREQLLKTLKEEFNCNSIQAAKKLIAKLKKEKEENDRKFNKEFARFQREYNIYLEQLEKHNSQASD